MGKLAAEDCMCPICMSVLIEPVTMPCSHTLCMPCFKQNVEESSLSCPLCRTRISIWARRATKTGKLINEKLWEDIRRSFPEKVQKRLLGEDDEDEEVSVCIPIVKIADPGEIRKEYEAEMEKLAKQRELERQKEIEASEALIRKLQEEESTIMETRRKELQKIEEEDKKLARELDEVIDEAGTDVPINFLMEESRSRLTRSSSVTTVSSTGGGNQRPPSTIESFINKMREAEKLLEADRASSASSLPYLCDTPDSKFPRKSDDIFKTDKAKDTDSVSLTYLCDTPGKLRENCKSRERKKNAGSNCSLNVSVKSKSRESNLWEYDFVGLNSENGGLFTDQLSRDYSKSTSSNGTDRIIHGDAESSHCGRSVVISPEVEIITDKLQEDLLDNSSLSSKCERTSRTSKLSRASSIQSVDSITQELNHFKPINICPITPPKKSANGKVIEPPLIRTTPRNLNKTCFSSPSNDISLSDIDACSPIMQRRLSELEEERKINVRRLSKSTLTVKTDDNDVQNENNSALASSSEDHKNVSKFQNSKKPHKRKVIMDDFVEGKLTSNNEGPKRKLMIPLESNIDDSMDFDIPPPLSENNNINNVDSDGRSSSNSSIFWKKNQNTSKSIQNKSYIQKQISRKKTPSGDKQRCDSFSPQRSIKDWIVKGDKSCKETAQSPSIFTDTLHTTCMGRDEVDGEVKKVNNKPFKPTIHSTIDQFVTKIDRKPVQEKDIRTKNPGVIQTRRKRKAKYKSADYVWPEYSPKKRETNLGNFSVVGETSDLECESDMEKEKEFSVQNTRQKRCLSGKESEKRDFKRRKVNEISKRNLTKELKSLKNTRRAIEKARKKAKRQRYEKTEDFVFAADSGPCLDLSGDKHCVDANLNIVKVDSDRNCNVFGREKQEEMDKLLAMKLAKEFEMEAKLGLRAIRFKGSDNEYKLRNRSHTKVYTCD